MMSDLFQRVERIFCIFQSLTENSLITFFSLYIEKVLILVTHLVIFNSRHVTIYIIKDFMVIPPSPITLSSDIILLS